MTIKILSFYPAHKKLKSYPMLNIDFFDAVSAKVSE
jgi:hypothetical protein